MVGQGIQLNKKGTPENTGVHILESKFEKILCWD